ncbi:putative nuclease HARBI1 [Leguminivora glycinivorella]|uniref:putative nuclease HARBI1 n=1 Tax=Leguminivora glycinivorella TaxID=1035111 RepID=UPI00200CDD66|nr:putative nuclease HARBI1 [Leguminivora glycinivorella]
MALFFILNEERRARRMQRTRLRDLANPFELPAQEFFHNYRMNKPIALYLCRELTPRQSHGLPVHIKVLVAVKFIAGGSYQREVGQDHTLCVTQRTASKYLTQVIAAINRSLKPKWITFPGNERERKDVAAAFEAKYGLPDLLGTLDCTHVSIFPPPRPHGLQLYINRKGKHTINVQLTPILNAAPGSAEERYTTWHCSVRNTIERTNGYLKGHGDALAWTTPSTIALKNRAGLFMPTTRSTIL